MGNQIVFPKIFFEHDASFVIETSVNLLDFKGYIESHTKETLEYIVNYGKYCKLYQFIKEDDNQQTLEFMLQTSYHLVKEGKEENKELASPEIEYRSLRHCIRHFEDNFDVMAVQTPIEQIYVHYAIRFLEENDYIY
jgi:hypothetical protein